MYVAITGSGKYRVIQFREDVRLPGTTKKKINVIKTIGNYERILAEDPDAMEKLRAEAKRITEERNLPMLQSVLKYLQRRSCKHRMSQDHTTSDMQ